MNGRFDHAAPRWQGAIAAFVDTARSHHTREDYRTYLSGLFRAKDPDEITAQDVQDFAESPGRYGQPVGLGSRRQRISVPARFYEFARRYIVPGETAPITTRNPTYELLPSTGETPRLHHVEHKEPFAQLAPAWRACVRDFLESIKNISGSESGAKNYSDRLRNFFDMFPGVSPGDLTRQESLAYVNRRSISSQRTGQEVSAQTKNGRMSAIKSFYKWASTYLVDGQPLYQKASPLVGVRTLKTGMNPHALSDVETRAFFSCIDRSTIRGRRAFCVFWLYWLTGRRRSEIARLRWGDLSQVTFSEDGHSRPGWQYTYTPKGNSRQRRTRELPESAVVLILDYLEFSGRLATIKPGDPLFAPTVPGRGRRSGANNEPLTPMYMYQEFKFFAELAGLDRSYTLHSLRHSAATVRFSLTRDIVKVSEFLGHSSIDMTRRYISAIVTPQDSDARLIEAKYAYLLK